jgi:hypothetical protein
MSEQKKSEKTQAEVQRDVFQALNGRQPKSDQELSEWLAPDEGKQATLFKVNRVFVLGRQGAVVNAVDPSTHARVLS